MPNNPFFSALGGGQQNMMQMLSQLKQNPMQFLMQRRFNIPQGIGSDPNAILSHLVQSGQISQNQVNSAYQMAQKFRR